MDAMDAYRSQCTNASQRLWAAPSLWLDGNVAGMKGRGGDVGSNWAHTYCAHTVPAAIAAMPCNAALDLLGQTTPKSYPTTCVHAATEIHWCLSNDMTSLGIENGVVPKTKKGFLLEQFLGHHTCT